MTSRDLMFQDDVQQMIRGAYEGLASADAAGASLYTDDQLAAVPPDAREWALGVGNPVAHAGLRPGQTVLDLGCGAGIDSLLAARAVGRDGRVIGVDLLPEMVDRAKANAVAADAENTTFVEGTMEAIPVPDATIDVLVSNGVLNLSPRKSRALAESFRVLRPGGRMCLSDLTVDDEELPTEVVLHPAAWAG